MSLCVYCGEKAGWLQNSHPACVAKANSTGQTIKAFATGEIVAGKTLPHLQSGVQQLSNDSNVREQYVREALQQGINDGVSQVALKSPVSVDERLRLQAIQTFYDVNPSPGKRWFGPAQVEMSHILWLVLNTITFGVDFEADFNLQHGEAPIFQTGNCVTYAEERTVSSSARLFQGLSLPVGGGMYYHIGGSQGHQERTSGLLPLDGGKILITSRGLYFGGQKTTLRIPLNRVIRYQPYVDGVGVCESHGAPKVFVFDYRGMDTGWFFYNLLAAITKRLQGNEVNGEDQTDIQKAHHAVAALQSAFDAWSAANDTFTNLFRTKDDVKAVTVTEEDVSTYSTAVVSLFAAASKLEEDSQFVSQGARDKYRQTLESVEARWGAFASVNDGHMNGDAFIPFLNEVAVFMKARNEYCQSDVRLTYSAPFRGTTVRENR